MPHYPAQWLRGFMWLIMAGPRKRDTDKKIVRVASLMVKGTVLFTEGTDIMPVAMSTTEDGVKLYEPVGPVRNKVLKCRQSQS